MDIGGLGDDSHPGERQRTKESELKEATCEESERVVSGERLGRSESASESELNREILSHRGHHF